MLSGKATLILAGIVVTGGCAHASQEEQARNRGGSCDSPRCLSGVLRADGISPVDLTSPGWGSVNNNAGWQLLLVRKGDGWVVKERRVSWVYA